MLPSKFTTRRTLSAIAIGIAAVAGPLVAPGVAVHLMGDPAADCTTQSTLGDNSVSCTPPSVQPTGAPSETDLTNDNSNIAGPGGSGN